MRSAPFLRHMQAGLGRTGDRRPASALATLLLTLLTLIIAIGGGAASVWILLEEAPPAGTVTAGPWTAFPVAGTREADPYSRARFVRHGGFPLGRAEGVAFTARRDSGGRALRRDCTYRIEGTVPPARFWTLHASPAEGAAPDTARRSGLHSQMLLRRPDGSVTITVSRHPAPGNWLAIGSSGPLQLVLTLFDPPLAADARLEARALPRIVRSACDA